MKDEGVIQFDLTLSPGEIPLDHYRELNNWRSLLFRLKLIGQDPTRYGGLGYGNVSQRITSKNESSGHHRFLVCGSQTGDKELLQAEDYCIIEEYNFAQHAVVARGSIKPSSESLTHAVLYELDNNIQAVVHVHSVELWSQAKTLDIYSTPASCRYGTQEMVEAVRSAKRQGLLNKCIFSMSGHQDGIISFGNSLEQAVMQLLREWVRVISEVGPKQI